MGIGADIGIFFKSMGISYGKLYNDKVKEQKQPARRLKFHNVYLNNERISGQDAGTFIENIQKKLNTLYNNRVVRITWWANTNPMVFTYGDRNQKHSINDTTKPLHTIVMRILD